MLNILPIIKNLFNASDQDSCLRTFYTTDPRLQTHDTMEWMAFDPIVTVLSDSSGL